MGFGFIPSRRLNNLHNLRISQSFKFLQSLGTQILPKTSKESATDTLGSIAREYRILKDSFRGVTPTHLSSKNLISLHNPSLKWIKFQKIACTLWMDFQIPQPCLTFTSLLSQSDFTPNLATISSLSLSLYLESPQSFCNKSPIMISDWP